MRRADHAGVFLLIAGTYTPVALISLNGSWRIVVLATVWTGAAAATVAKCCWVAAPKWIAALIGITLGWVGVAGLAYTAGAVIYARRRPDPAPLVFGYHELFHALTILALACQYAAIAFYVVRVT
jgi:hemolysin III